MSKIDYKAVTEILENFLNDEKVEIFGMSVGEERQLRMAIENLLKENQAYKDRNDILRDRVQENERKIKETANMFANEKKEYLSRIKELEDEQQGYKDRIKELKIALEEVEELLEDSIQKSSVKEKMKELNKEEQELQNSISDEEREEYSDANISFSLMDIEIRRNVLQELLGESND